MEDPDSGLYGPSSAWDPYSVPRFCGPGGDANVPVEISAAEIEAVDMRGNHTAEEEEARD